MNTFVINGEAARLQWVYHEAAALSRWSITPDDCGGGTLTATVIQLDTFRASQRPLTLVVPRSGTPWRWSIQELQIADGRLSAVLGPPE